MVGKNQEAEEENEGGSREVRDVAIESTKEDITPDEDPSADEIKGAIRNHVKGKNKTVEEEVKRLNKSTELREFMFGTKNVNEAFEELLQEN